MTDLSKYTRTFEDLCIELSKVTTPMGIRIGTDLRPLKEEYNKVLNDMTDNMNNTTYTLRPPLPEVSE